MIRTPTIPTLVDPKLIDAVISQFQTGLIARLTWLSHAFGKAQIMKEMKDGREIVFPAVFVGGRDYLKTFPDDHIGNFSFFVIDDGEDVKFLVRSTDFQTRFSLIFWFDFRSVYPTDWEERTIDNVKEDVLRAFALIRFAGCQVSIDKVFERPSNVFREFSDREIDLQFTMRPFGMIRVEGDIRFNQLTTC